MALSLKLGWVVNVSYKWMCYRQAHNHIPPPYAVIPAVCPFLFVLSKSHLSYCSYPHLYPYPHPKCDMGAVTFHPTTHAVVGFVQPQRLRCQSQNYAWGKKGRPVMWLPSSYTSILFPISIYSLIPTHILSPHFLHHHPVSCWAKSANPHPSPTFAWSLAVWTHRSCFWDVWGLKMAGNGSKIG